MGRTPACPFCGQAVEHGQRYYAEVTGWEAVRSQGGTNALRLRIRSGRLAHWHCIDRAVHGGPGQQDLSSLEPPPPPSEEQLRQERVWGDVDPDWYKHGS